jgi:hypothetical protein
MANVLGRDSREIRSRLFWIIGSGLALGLLVGSVLLYRSADDLSGYERAKESGKLALSANEDEAKKQIEEYRFQLELAKQRYPGYQGISLLFGAISISLLVYLYLELRGTSVFFGGLSGRENSEQPELYPVKVELRKDENARLSAAIQILESSRVRATAGLKQQASSASVRSNISLSLGVLLAIAGVSAVLLMNNQSIGEKNPSFLGITSSRSDGASPSVLDTRELVYGDGWGGSSRGYIPKNIDEFLKVREADLKYEKAREEKEISTLVGSWVSRIPLLIVIEIFAYFFLRLYRNILTDITYFQNEMSTIEMKYSSVSTAILSKNSKNIDEILKDLAHSERSRILQSGQTTVDLQQIKLDNEPFEKALDALASALKAKK